MIKLYRLVKKCQALLASGMNFYFLNTTNYIIQKLKCIIVDHLIEVKVYDRFGGQLHAQSLCYHLNLLSTGILFST